MSRFENHFLVTNGDFWILTLIISHGSTEKQLSNLSIIDG